MMLRYNILIWVILIAIAIPLMQRKNKPEVVEVDSEREEFQYQDSANFADESSTIRQRMNSTLIITHDPTFKESVLSLRTLHMWVMIVLASGFPFYVASNFKSYASQSIKNDQFITAVGAVGTTLNGLSRVFWATLTDYFGFKYVYMSLLVIQITVAFTFVLVHEVKILFFLWT